MHGNAINLTGQTFGRLKVISPEPSDKYGHMRWRCKCECGNVKTVLAYNLINGMTTSCGCVQRERASEAHKPTDITGQKFGRLTALEIVGRTAHGDTIWECRCECGKKTTARYSRLKNGHTTSCGCWNAAPKKHGQAKHGNSSRIYRIWSGMKQRCTNPNVERYPRYGGRGIKVCPEWAEDFGKFYAWAMAHGYKDDLTIDRIDNDGDYTPENCRWVTGAENTRKRWEK